MTFSPEDVRQDKTIEILREKVNSIETDLATLASEIRTGIAIGRYLVIGICASLGIDIIPLMGDM